MKNAILFFIAIILFYVLAPLGFLYALVVHPKAFSQYVYKCAISTDQSGNVVLKWLFNDLLIKKGGYEFGNEDETISSAIGRNLETQTLSFIGKALNSFLNMFEEDHAKNSIGS